MVELQGDHGARHGDAHRGRRRRRRRGRHDGRRAPRRAAHRHGRPGGRLEPASVVATDTARTWRWSTCPWTCPSRPSPTTPPEQRPPDLTLSLVPAGRHVGRPPLHARLGDGAGHAIASGPAGACRPSPRPPPRRAAAGEPLLNAGGAVVGILYDPDPAPPPPRPSSRAHLVVGVADDLRSKDRVVPGWLGVAGTDAPGGPGPRSRRCSPTGRPPAGSSPAR